MENEIIWGDTEELLNEESLEIKPFDNNEYGWMEGEKRRGETGYDEGEPSYSTSEDGSSFTPSTSTGEGKVKTHRKQVSARTRKHHTNKIERILEQERIKRELLATESSDDPSDLLTNKAPRESQRKRM
eukprot:UN24812